MMQLDKTSPYSPLVVLEETRFEDVESFFGALKAVYMLLSVSAAKYQLPKLDSPAH